MTRIIGVAASLNEVAWAVVDIKPTGTHQVLSSGTIPQGSSLDHSGITETLEAPLRRLSPDFGAVAAPAEHRDAISSKQLVRHVAHGLIQGGCATARTMKEADVHAAKPGPLAMRSQERRAVAVALAHEKDTQRPDLEASLSSKAFQASCAAAGEDLASALSLMTHQDEADDSVHSMMKNPDKRRNLADAANLLVRSGKAIERLLHGEVPGNAGRGLLEIGTKVLDQSSEEVAVVRRWIPSLDPDKPHFLRVSEEDNPDGREIPANDAIPLTWTA